jgi:hypothetical protein
MNLKVKTCTCQACQVKRCLIHSAAFTISISNAKWEDYADTYFSVAHFKAICTVSIVTMPSRDEWIECNLGYKMLPPILRYHGRPRKK